MNKRNIIIIVSLIALLMSVTGIIYGQSNPQPVVSFNFNTEPEFEIFELYGGTVANGQLEFDMAEDEIGEFWITPPLKNYAVEMDFTVNSGIGLLWVALHYQEDKYLCRFEFSYAAIEGYADTGIYKGDNECEEWQYISDQEAPSITENQTVRLRAEVMNNTYKLLVDGVEIISETDTTYTEGGTGIFIVGPTKVTFDNVALYDLDATESGSNAAASESESGGTTGSGGLFGGSDSADSSDNSGSTSGSGGLFGGSGSSGGSDSDSGGTTGSGGLFGGSGSSGANPDATPTRGGLFGN